MRYRRIHVQTFADAKFLELSPPQPCGQYLWIYLLAGPYTTQIPGLFVAGEAALGWQLDGLRSAFNEIASKGMAKADWAKRLVWLPNAIKYNQPDNPNVVKSWATAWELIPECDLKSEACNSLLASLPQKEPFLEAFKSFAGTRILNGMPNSSANGSLNGSRKSEAHGPKRVCQIRNRNRIRNRIRKIHAQRVLWTILL